MDKEEYNRLIEFRQVKQEIRGSKDYLIVGIDVAKEKHHAFFGTATGKTLFKGMGRWDVHKIITFYSIISTFLSPAIFSPSPCRDAYRRLRYLEISGYFRGAYSQSLYCPVTKQTPRFCFSGPFPGANKFFRLNAKFFCRLLRYFFYVVSLCPKFIPPVSFLFGFF